MRAPYLSFCMVLIACGSDDGGKDAPGTGGASSTGGAGGTSSGGSAATGASGGVTGGGGGVGGNAGGAGTSSGGGAGAGGSAGSGGGSGGTAGSGGDPNCVPSSLYGKNGELWTATGRLREYAWAGYRTGNVPLPNPTTPTKSVTDFGAKPDDAGDDTQAFLDAIAGTPSGVLTVPAGKFVLTQRLTIKKPNFVLRGAGEGKTVLYFPKSLGDIYGLTFNSANQSNWSFSGAFIEVSGSDGGAKLADVTAAAKLGDTTLKVSTTTGITAGGWVRLMMTDAAGSLFKALHQGHFPGNVAEDGGKQVFRFYSKVKSVAAGTVVLERPLPLAVDTQWKPELRAVKPSVSEVGIEHMTMEFAGTTYPGHFKEHGYNAIQLSGVLDSWVKNVTVLNADYGVNLLGSCQFVTVTDVTLDTNMDRGTLVGHHGLDAGSGGDLLFTRFDVKKKFVHDLTVDGYARGIVWSNGKGVDLCMDHHGRAPYGSLWTNLDMGAGTRPFQSGGSANRMPHSAAYSTFWNLTAAKALALPANDYGPLLNFVAFQTGATSVSSPYDWKLEKIANTELCQPNLHEAMLADMR